MDQKDPEENNAQLQKSLLEQIPAVLYIAEFGAQTRWIYISPQIETLLGYSPSEWMANGGLWLDRVHPDDREETLNRHTSGQQGHKISIEYRIFSRDGAELW